MIFSHRSCSNPLTSIATAFFDNDLEIPKLEKIVINMGVGEAVKDSKKIEVAVKELAAISGQKPVVTKAKLSIANFNLREGMRVGIKVTLRSKRMWDFWDRLVNLSLPRIRDFRGISANSFDGNGNYNLGIREHIIFPEIDYGNVDKIRSFQITIATSAKTYQEGYKLLQLLGMPFMEVNNG